MAQTSVESVREAATTTQDDASAARRDDRRHVLHSWSSYANLQPVVVTGG